MPIHYNNTTIHFNGSNWVAQHDDGSGCASAATKERVMAMVDRAKPKPAAGVDMSIRCNINGQQVKLA